MKYYDFVAKSPKIPPMVVVEGTERVLSDLAEKILIERLGESTAQASLDAAEVVKFRAPDLDSYRPIAESLTALGFFSSRRIIIVRDIAELRAADRRELWAVASTVTAPNTLILEDLVEPNKKSKPEPFGRLAEKTALLIDTTADGKARASFAGEIAHAAGVTIDADAIRLLVDGEADLAAMRNDIEKLALTHETIRADDLSRDALSIEDPKAYRFASALLEGRTAQAYETAAEIFANDPRGGAIPLLSALANEYSLVWELARPGGALAARFRFRERSLRPIAALLGERCARRGYERALRGFEAIVTGRADDPRICFETVTAECAYERDAIARRARRSK